MKHFGKKTEYNGSKFDSQKEFFFFQRFLEKYYNDPNSEFIVKIHPSYPIINSWELDPGLKIRGASYKPDFTVEDNHGNLLHIFDVKNSFTTYGVDAACRLRFKLFTERYKVPVECVVPRKNDFKVKIFGTTKKTKIHTFGGIDYDWRKAL